eukprot:TRINITY_DN67949_c5_g17_i1.p1 TRINITY_DN67949_c5_g17~~TRINITY_DN67949_c5_g17_i1.p1  ORF type:complete len:379 (-),score=37.21 TRINITY_DN67949_c5_g17_i1:162-1277(-)
MTNPDERTLVVEEVVNKLTEHCQATTQLDIIRGLRIFQAQCSVITTGILPYAKMACLALLAGLKKFHANEVVMNELWITATLLGTTLGMCISKILTQPLVEHMVKLKAAKWTPIMLKSTTKLLTCSGAMIPYQIRQWLEHYALQGLFDILYCKHISSEAEKSATYLLRLLVTLCQIHPTQQQTPYLALILRAIVLGQTCSSSKVRCASQEANHSLSNIIHPHIQPHYTYPTSEERSELLHLSMLEELEKVAATATQGNAELGGDEVEGENESESSDDDDNRLDMDDLNEEEEPIGEQADENPTTGIEQSSDEEEDEDEMDLEEQQQGYDEVAEPPEVITVGDDDSSVSSLGSGMELVSNSNSGEDEEAEGE